jgi:cobalt-zinc-cadmium efflux system protein
MNIRILNNRWLNLLLRILLGAVFIYASLDKLFHPLDFARQVAGYQMIPELLLAVVAAVLPFLELITGILLMAGIWTLPALAWIGILLILFMGGIAQAMARGLNIDCGCFSTASNEKDLGLKTLLRDGILLLVWLQLFWHYWRKSKVAEQ